MKDWYKNPILKDSDYDALETAAALKEFGEGTPRSQAEKEAYKEYKRNQHLQASAHHLRGMRMAQAGGDLDEAAMHGEAYSHHMDALGLDPIDQVPDEVKALLEAEDKPRQYRFKAHGADAFLTQTESKAKEEE
jgi:hypothetical protein